MTGEDSFFDKNYLEEEMGTGTIAFSTAASDPHERGIACLLESKKILTGINSGCKFAPEDAFVGSAPRVVVEKSISLLPKAGNDNEMLDKTRKEP